MITSLLSALILGTARAADGADKIPRPVYVGICALVVAINIPDMGYTWLYFVTFAAWMWVLCVLTMLPPHALFSTVHGNPPGRGDGRWNFLQSAARWLTRKWLRNDCRDYWICYALLYGAIRALLIIPAVIWLNEPWLMLAMLQGVLMWVCGKASIRYAVRMQEFISTAFIGAMI